MMTNAVRLAKAAGLDCETRSYPVDEEDLSAAHVAAALDIDPDRVFKTLLVLSERSEAFVCVLPGSMELDLKKAAKAFGCKSAQLLPLRELEPLTGYVRGGCSPIGLKKRLPIFLDETARLWGSISVSAGARGLQLIIQPDDLAKLTEAVFADLI